MAEATVPGCIPRSSFFEGTDTPPFPAVPQMATRIAELEAWKESALAVMNGINLQAVGKELDINLGADIGPMVLPGIKSIKSQLAVAHAAAAQLMQERDAAQAYLEGYKATEPWEEVVRLELLLRNVAQRVDQDSILCEAYTDPEGNPHIVTTGTFADKTKEWQIAKKIAAYVGKIWVDTRTLTMFDMIESQAELTYGPKPGAYSGTLEELNYLTLGLASEAGEVAGKVKKLDRDHNIGSASVVRDEASEASLAAIEAELGDVLWYWLRVARLIGSDPAQVMAALYVKLQDRLDRGAIHGEGDKR